MEEYEFCILTDEKDIIEYEKKLYNDFSKRSPYRWIAKNHQMIDNCRLKSKISYEDQTVYGIKKEGQLIAGASINFNKENNF